MSDIPAVSLDHVSKSFGNKVAVKEVTLSVRKGEIFGFLGPNGAGKSTTIRMILDILRADSGEIQLLGESSRQAAHIHRRLGYMSGEMVLDLDLTGAQYLGLINYQHGGGHQHNIDRLAKLLEVQLNKKIGTYSRGNRQKIALIGALLHEPELLILDEPTTGFDPLVQSTFSKLIQEFADKGGTVFMSSHILSEVQELCHNVAFIKDGMIVETKTIEELTTTATKRVRLTMPVGELGAAHKDLAKLQGVTGMREAGDSLDFAYSGDIHTLLRLLAHHKLTDVIIREPELEEIFGHYYEGITE